jgi:pimeloyl-ACP methyl ester carboxylesterase
MKKVLSWLAAHMAFALAVLAVCFYAPDKSRAELEAAYPGEYRTVDGVRLRIRDTGPRDAPVVVMLHGFCASLDTWEPWALELSSRYRVVRFDLPGFGLTGADPTGDYSDAREIGILVGLMDQLGIAKASIVGNSMGGRIAWNFTAAHPERVVSQILVSPDGFASPGFSYGRAPDTPLPMRALPYLAPRGLLKAGLALAYGNDDALTEETVGRYRDLLMAPGVRQAIIERMGQSILRDPAPTLARIKVPTLIIWGEKDGVIPVGNAGEYMRDLPNARLVLLPNMGHLPFEEDPTASLVPVQKFLSGAAET